MDIPSVDVIDSLRHERLATTLLSAAEHLPLGAVIAVQGPWGSGKTDTLSRIYSGLKSQVPKPPWACAPLWLNPWKYARNDLLTPLTLQLLELVPKRRQAGAKALWKAGEAVALAGTDILMRSVSGGALSAESIQTTKDLLQRVFAARDLQPGADLKLDPVAQLGQQFSKLVTGVIKLSYRHMDSQSRLLVCVDDMDRCIPSKQVALVEALHFLTSTGAPATFVVAVDPRLLHQALATHYGVDTFDGDRYLDKLFDLRVTLPEPTAEDIRGLLQEHLQTLACEMSPGITRKDIMSRFLQKGLDVLAEGGSRALSVPALRNPRMIRRMFDRLFLLAAANQDEDGLALPDEEDIASVVLWLGIAERWPLLRQVLSDTKDVKGRLDHVASYYMPLTTPQAKQGLAPEIQRLPDAKQDPDLAFLMSRLPTDKARIGFAFWRTEKLLRDVGL